MVKERGTAEVILRDGKEVGRLAEELTLEGGGEVQVIFLCMLAGDRMVGSAAFWGSDPY